jgi:hypothetical protein
MRMDAYSNLSKIIRNYGEFDLGRICIGGYYATDTPYILNSAVCYLPWSDNAQDSRCWLR